jgi:RimJ/RimL family protein N-acetyltransferase
METDIRTLTVADRSKLEGFLQEHPATTMFMRSNLRRAGMAEEPTERFEAVYVGAFQDGELSAVVSHNWNGMLLVAGSEGLTEAARRVVGTSGLKLSGISGSLEKVEEIRGQFGLADAPTSLDSPEHLYSLDLENLQTPALLHEPGVVCRLPKSEEFELLCDWRMDYHLWLGGEEDDEGGRSIPERLRHKIEDDLCRVLAVEGEPVSYTAFNATLPEQVQVGGVWTPPDLRGRGYARAVVAGHLLDARDEGVERAILFTAFDNEPAQAVYEALGFERIGEYGLVLFEESLGDLN